MDLVWAALILIGAIAMRGAGCTYNDIVDQDLDAQVERTALRPLPAGTVTTRQAWKWTFAQIGVGFLVWLCLPFVAKVVAMLALPLVAAYPFMKRITWFPQVWLGLTFNWAFLVACAISAEKIEHVLYLPFEFYLGLVFWTVGYDTIYACQDMKDDAIIGVKSTARKFGKKVNLAVFICYFLAVFLIFSALTHSVVNHRLNFCEPFLINRLSVPINSLHNYAIIPLIPFAIHLLWQTQKFSLSKTGEFAKIFKSNVMAALLLIFSILLFHTTLPYFFEAAELQGIKFKH